MSRPKKITLPTDRPVCRIGALTFADDGGMWRQFISANGKLCGTYAGVGARHRSAKLLDAWRRAATRAAKHQQALLALPSNPRISRIDGVATYIRWWNAARVAETRRQAFDTYYWGPR